MNRACVLLSAVILAGTNVTAQPRAQPSDSIVKFAIDAAKRPAAGFVLLLEETELRLEPDGRSTRRRRQVVQLFTEAAARTRAEQSFNYSPAHQSLTLNWVRVLKPSGEVVSDKAAVEQEADVPVAIRNPVYQDQKVRRVSLAGVNVGTIVDLSWTTEEKAPYRPGDFYDLWYANSIADVVQSRYVLDIPFTFEPRIVERNIRVKRVDSVASGRRVLTWTARNLDHVQLEPFAADSNSIIQSITVSPPGTWGALAQWYHGLSKDRYALSPDIASRVDSVVSAGRPQTRIDTIRALHRWVAQDVRYVSVSLGIGGYQPRTPAEVLSTGFGDCKDKTTLFVAALRKYGISASPVLLAQSGRGDRNAPSIFQFDHAIAAVRNGSAWTFTDLTAEVIPFGSIPPSYQGGMGIVVLPDGGAEEVTFPAVPVDSNVSTVRVHGDLQANGDIVLRVDERAIGAPSLRTRQSFYAPVDSAPRSAAMRALGGVYFRDGLADSLAAFNGKDLSSEVHISFRVTAGSVMRSVGGVRLFTMPGTLRGPAKNFGVLAGNLAAAPSRKFPVDVSRIVGPFVAVSEFQLTLPEGWTAELPPNLATSSIAGRYESAYVLEGRVLRVTRRVQGARGVYPPVRIAEVVAWLKAIAADDVEFIQLKPPA